MNCYNTDYKYDRDIIRDKINIYEYLYHHKIMNENAYILLVLEKMWIVSMLFNDCNIIEYEKKYNSFIKRESSHLMISNF